MKSITIILSIILMVISTAHLVFGNFQEATFYAVGVLIVDSVWRES